VCAGFYKNKTTPFLELMKATGKIRFVDPMSLKGEKRLKCKRTGKNKKRDMH